MEHHDLEIVLDRAHRSSVHLMTVAGLVSGLLLGIGFLGLQAGNPRFAIAIWAVAIAVALGLAIAARQLRSSATSLMQIGLVALDARAHVASVQAAMVQRVGEVQTQLQRLQADVDRLMRTPPPDAVQAVRGTPPPPVDLEPTTALDRPA